MKTLNDCLIIGAGMAGLTAARRLQSRGINVTLLDKGRGVGGRMATRWLKMPESGKALFDHGAQFFTVRDARFQTMVDEWLAAGLVREWSRGFPQTPAASEVATCNDGHPRYCGATGMNAIARHLAQGLEVHLNAPVERLACDDQQWHAQLTNGETFSADALILTPPVPQSLALLEAFTPHWPAARLQALQNITYDPCFAVLAVLDRPSGLPAPGALQLRKEPIAWIADNQRKGVSPDVPTVTIHAGPEFTRKHWDAPHHTVAESLLAAARPLLKADVASWHVHRWRYSQPVVLHPEPCFFIGEAAPLVFAGDAFGTPRVEGAYLSGIAAADALLNG